MSVLKGKYEFEEAHGTPPQRRDPNALLRRLDELREIDGMVDLSRGTIQIRILLLLRQEGPLDTAEISSRLGQRRKAVTDALRKMHIKGLVEPHEGESRYRLTQTGASCLDVLASFAAPEQCKNPRVQNFGRNDTSPACFQAIEIEENIANISILTQALVALGTSKEHRASLKELARQIGLSQQRTKGYLDYFLSMSNPPLLKRYSDETRTSKILSKLGIKYKRYETYYALTQDGAQQFYRLPFYFKSKKSLVYRIFGSIFRTTNPKRIFIRMNLATYFLGILSALSMFYAVEFVPIVWTLFSAAMIIAVLADQFLLNFS